MLINDERIVLEPLTLTTKLKQLLNKKMSLEKCNDDYDFLHLEAILRGKPITFVLIII